MVDYKQILRLRAEGVSQRGIADALGCSRNTIAAVFAAANGAGIGFGQVADLAADEVRNLLLPEPVKPESDRVVPDFEHVHRELARPSVTLLLLWNEYVAKCRESSGVPYQYSFFNEQDRRRSSMNSIAGGSRRRARRCGSCAARESPSRSTGPVTRWPSLIRSPAIRSTRGCSWLPCRIRRIRMSRRSPT